MNLEIKALYNNQKEASEIYNQLEKLKSDFDTEVSIDFKTGYRNELNYSKIKKQEIYSFMIYGLLGGGLIGSILYSSIVEYSDMLQFSFVVLLMYSLLMGLAGAGLMFMLRFIGYEYALSISEQDLQDKDAVISVKCEQRNFKKFMNFLRNTDPARIIV